MHQLIQYRTTEANKYSKEPIKNFQKKFYKVFILFLLNSYKVVSWVSPNAIIDDFDRRFLEIK